MCEILSQELITSDLFTHVRLNQLSIIVWYSGDTCRSLRKRHKIDGCAEDADDSTSECGFQEFRLSSMRKFLFEVTVPYLLILKWGLKTGLDFHNYADKSIILIPMRDNKLLIVMGKFDIKYKIKIIDITVFYKTDNGSQNG